MACDRGKAGLREHCHRKGSHANVEVAEDKVPNTTIQDKLGDRCGVEAEEQEGPVLTG